MGAPHAAAEHREDDLSSELFVLAGRLPQRPIAVKGSIPSADPRLIRGIGLGPAAIQRDAPPYVKCPSNGPIRSPRKSGTPRCAARS